MDLFTLLGLDGNVYRDDELYILYRRYLSTTTSFWQVIKKRMMSEMKEMSKTKNDKHSLSKIIIQIYADDISKKNIKKIYVISRYKVRFLFGYD